MPEALPEVYLARHGETAWTVANRHTGRTDLPLTERGERNAANLHDRLRGLTFNRVLVSPLGRARRTCELAGFADVAEAVLDLTDWDYDSYEGRRTAEIRVERPGWYSFRDGCPGASRSPTSGPAPTASSLACGTPAAAPSCSATATSSACWRPGGSGRPPGRVPSPDEHGFLQHPDL